MTIYYEMLLLFRPDLTQEQYDTAKSKIEEIVVTKSGEIKNYDRWGKYLLAYPIKKCTYGVYVLVRFGVKEEDVKEVLEQLKMLFTLRFNMFLMRYVFIRLGKTISQEYCRPDSLEEAPRRERSYENDDLTNKLYKRSRNNPNFSSRNAIGVMESVDQEMLEEIVLEENSVMVEGTI